MQDSIPILAPSRRRYGYKIPRRRKNHREFKKEYIHKNIHDREEPNQGEGN